jgi:hypothetical protein
MKITLRELKAIIKETVEQMRPNVAQYPSAIKGATKGPDGGWDFRSFEDAVRFIPELRNVDRFLAQAYSTIIVYPANMNVDSLPLPPGSRKHDAGGNPWWVYGEDNRGRIRTL